MALYKHIFFVCINNRGEGSRKQSCGQCRGEEVLERLKAWTRAQNLRKTVRVTRAGCLDLCSQGCVVAAFSDDAAMPQTWYTHVTPAQVDALMSSHVLANAPFAPLVRQTED